MHFIIPLFMATSALQPSSIETISVSPVLSEQEYKEAIEVLSETSQHAQLILDTIDQRVLPKLEKRYFFLDVGAGPGFMATSLAAHFEEADAVEPNPELWPLYNSDSVRLIRSSWSEFSEERSYDFVLCSHVLYHMPKDEMKAFIKKLLFYTKKDGLCLIALMAPRGENHQLHSSFNPNYVHSGQIEEVLNELGVSYEVARAQNRFSAKSFRQMASLCRFLILEDCLTKDQRDHLDEVSFNREISSYVATLKRSDGSYTLDQDEDYFIINP